MMRGTGVLHLAAVALALLNAPSAIAHDYSLGEIRIIHPSSRATPTGAKVGGGYLAIQNSGRTPDRLIGAVTDVSARVEVHEMNIVEGIMRMRELAGGVVVDPGASVVLKPGGIHLMLIDLRRPLKEGERFNGTLRFEKAGEVQIEFQVQGLGTGPVPTIHEGH